MYNNARNIKQFKGTEMSVSKSNSVKTSPCWHETEYLSPGSDIPSSSGQRAERRADRGREATTTTTRLETETDLTEAWPEREAEAPAACGTRGHVLREDRVGGGWGGLLPKSTRKIFQTSSADFESFYSTVHCTST